jgi:thiamine-monophosphate kinase
MTQLKNTGELNLIRDLMNRFPVTGAEVIKGMGDDCAVLESGGEALLFTTDIMVEGVHFLSKNRNPVALATKLLAVNLSDVAAMGGRAKAGLLTVALPDETEIDFWNEFIKALSDEFLSRRIDLIGGDTSSSPGPLILNLALIGTADIKNVLYRSGASEGEAIYVSRMLGDSAAGLDLLRLDEPGLARGAFERLVTAHGSPRAEEDLGPFLAETGLVTAMIDISDGLTTDLSHVAEASGLGAELRLKDLPVSDEAKSLGRILKKDPVNWALTGGEDYALLFTAPESRAVELENLIREHMGRDIRKVGRMKAAPGLTGVDGESRFVLTDRGYEHFQSQGE